MTDATAKPVSMRKKPETRTDVPRPNSVVILAALMVVSGLAAVIAALTFYGEHDFLVRNLAKSEPQQKLTTATVATVSSQTAAGMTSALSGDVGSALTTAKINAVADRTVTVFRSSVPSVNITKDERNDQAKNVRSDVTDALKKIDGQLTSAKVSSAGTTVTKSVKDDLTSLQKSQLTAKQIDDKASKIPTSTLILSLFLLVALSFVGFGAYKGRYWGRWAVAAVWVLASFTGTPAGFTSLLLIGSDLPLPYKIGSALSAAALTVAVVFAFLTPTRKWFDAHRPVAAAGAPQRRGMFAPRVPPPSSRTSAPARGEKSSASASSASASSASTSASSATASMSAPDRARSKKRAAAESARTGADLARSRAKTASKSRRTTES